jgi:hypothetical protein
MPMSIAGLMVPRSGGRARGVLLCMGLMLVSASGCDHEAETSAPVLNEQHKVRAAYVTDPTDIYVGKTLMRIPWNMFSITSKGQLQGDEPFRAGQILLYVRWPEMQGRQQVTGYHEGQISLVIRAASSAVPPSGLSADEKVRRFSPVVGPFINEELGLREWHHELHRSNPFYARLDASYRTRGGIEPFVRCSSWDKDTLYVCKSGGRISDNLAYSYEFRPSLLKSWTEIDEDIYELLTSLIVNKD